MPQLAIKRAVQSALYWAKVGHKNDQVVVDAPAELKVRWNNKRREIRDANGAIIALEAQVVVNRELVPGSLVWHAPELESVNGQTALQQWHGAGIEPGWDVFSVETVDEVPNIKTRFTQRSYGLKRFQDYVPGGWHLLRIADLKVFLHGDHGLYTTSVGTNEAETNADPVGRWVSLDENERQFVQATAANRPTLRTNEANGKQVVRFDGSNDTLALAAGVPVATDFTAYLAGKISSGQALKLTGTGTVLSMTHGGTALVTDTGGTVSASTTLSTGNVIGRFKRESNSVTFAATGHAAATLGSLTGAFSFGTLPNNAADVRHVLVFDRALTTAEQAVVENFLKADLAVELP